MRLISIQQCSLARLHSQTWCLRSYLEIIFCLFVLFFVLFCFFHFQPSVVVCFPFLYKFCGQFLSKQIFAWVWFFLCRLWLLKPFYFVRSHWFSSEFGRFCLLPFFSFVVFNGPKFPVYYFAFFLLVRLLLLPAPTSLTLDPRVFSFSIIVAAEKRDHLGDDVA